MRFSYQDKEYPARLTMGAHLIYREQTGTDFTLAATRGEVGGVEIATLLYAAIVSACRVDGVPFEATFEEFCDRVTPEEVSGWYAAAQEEQLAEAKKKTLTKAKSQQVKK